jgi:hypothetical protein
VSTRGRYRFEEYPSGRDMPGDCIVLDAAIHAARQISKHREHGVAVIDHGQKPPTLRGVAHAGCWSWAATCRPCTGTGTVPIYGGLVPCGQCQGKGVRPDESYTGARG